MLLQWGRGEVNGSEMQTRDLRDPPPPPSLLGPTDWGAHTRSDHRLSVAPAGQAPLHPLLVFHTNPAFLLRAVLGE